MKIAKLVIKDINAIKELDLCFHEGLNLICGTNGIGKTTILNCISYAFSPAYKQNVKRNANASVGRWKISVTQIRHKFIHKIGEIYQNIDSPDLDVELETDEFIPKSGRIAGSSLQFCSPDLIVFKSFRDIDYMELSNVARDPKRTENETAIQQIDLGVSSIDIKNWFINRFMFSKHSHTLTESQITNFNLSKQCFSVLDKSIFFSRVIPDTLEIMVNTPHGEVYFEYLSSGYKSCLYILLGLIKEIEYRFKDENLNAADFDGVIIIDEIDLHLHPQWQAEIMNLLKTTFPNAQIIAATHSPSMIQAANPNEVIPLVQDENGNVCVKNIETSEYGFQGWSLEEILKDVMGVENTTSKLYSDTLREFNCALDHDDYDKIMHYYHKLDKMLHNRNPLRKMLKIQIAGIEEREV